MVWERKEVWGCDWPKKSLKKEDATGLWLVERPAEKGGGRHWSALKRKEELCQHLERLVSTKTEWLEKGRRGYVSFFWLRKEVWPAHSKWKLQISHQISTRCSAIAATAVQLSHSSHNSATAPTVPATASASGCCCLCLCHCHSNCFNCQYYCFLLVVFNSVYVHYCFFFLQL
jgi:hypothetical protein